MPRTASATSAARLASPAIDPRARQRHMLPGLRFVALVEREGRELGRERPLAARGPEPHVDLIEAPGLGRRGQRGEQPLRQARIIERSAERLCSVRLPGVGGEIVDDDEVEVRGRSHLARAELAERDDRDAAAAHSPVFGDKPVGHARQQRSDQALRERAVSAAGAVGIEPARQEIEADEEHFLGGEIARAVERILVTVRLGDIGLDALAHRAFLQALVEILHPPGIDRGVENMRARRDHLREARSGARARRRRVRASWRSSAGSTEARPRRACAPAPRRRRRARHRGRQSRRRLRAARA